MEHFLLQTVLQETGQPLNILVDILMFLKGYLFTTDVHLNKRISKYSPKLKYLLVIYGAINENIVMVMVRSGSGQGQGYGQGQDYFKGRGQDQGKPSGRVSKRYAQNFSEIAQDLGF